jgi:hypothetical protein
MNSEFDIGDLLRATLQSLRAAGVRVLFVLLLLAAAGAVVDAELVDPSAATALNLPLSIGAVFAQYFLTREALRDAGTELASHAGFASVFVLGIVSGLAVLLGLVLLVIPGLILIIRWWVAVPVLLDRDVGVTEALRVSWRETHGRFWTILMALILIWLPVIAVVGIAAFAFADGTVGLASALIGNIALYGGLIAGWHCAVAAYTLLPHDTGLTEIFG